VLAIPGKRRVFSPDWKHECEKDRKAHLQIGTSSEGKRAENGQLEELNKCKTVDHPLGNFSDVMRWWVGVLKNAMFERDFKKPL